MENFRATPVMIGGSKYWQVETKQSFFGLFSWWKFEAFAENQKEVEEIFKHLRQAAITNEKEPSREY